MERNTTYYLIRHGQTVWNQEHRYSGQHDSPLTPLGIEQARLAGKVLARALSSRTRNNERPLLYCSTLGRAVATAELVGQELAFLPATFLASDALREYCFGEWEGRTYDEVKIQYASLYSQRERDKWNAAPPGGETYAQLRARVARFLLSLPPAETVVIVAHEVVNRMVRGILLHLEPAAIPYLKQANGTVIVIRPDSTELVLESEETLAA